MSGGGVSQHSSRASLPKYKRQLSKSKHKSRMRLRNKKRKTDARQEPETSANPVTHHLARLSDEVVLSIIRFLPQKDLLNDLLINKKFRNVSRDRIPTTKLILDFNDIKQSVKSYSKLFNRGKKLTSLEITNKSLNLRSLNLKLFVTRAKKSLKSLKVDSSIRRLSEAAFKKLGQMNDLISIKMTLATNSHNPSHEVQLLSNLDQLKELRVCVRWRFGDGRSMGTAVGFPSEALYPFKKLRIADLEIETTDSPTVDGLTCNNPGAPPSLPEVKAWALLSCQ